MPTSDASEPADLEPNDPQEPLSPKTTRDPERGRMTVRAASLSYDSPLPPPEILAGYGRTQADAPERILAMAERQEAHRQQMEKIVVEAGAANASKAMNIAAYLATLFVGASVYMVHEHYAVYGIVTLGSTLATLAGVNLYGRTAQRKERTEKARLLNESDQSRQKRRRLAQSPPPSEPEDQE